MGSSFAKPSSIRVVYLPLHVTTRMALDRYIDQRRRGAGADPHLFVTRRGGKLSHTVVAETFHQVLKSPGFPIALLVDAYG